MDQKTVKQLEQLIQTLLNKAMVNVATKDDLKNFATKNDLKNLPSKNDLIAFATKDDLISLEKRLGEKFVTKDDLQKLELRLHDKIKYDIDNAVIQISAIVDKRKADRTEVKELDKRVTHIESKLAL